MAIEGADLERKIKQCTAKYNDLISEYKTLFIEKGSERANEAITKSPTFIWIKNTLRELADEKSFIDYIFSQGITKAESLSNQTVWYWSAEILNVMGLCFGSDHGFNNIFDRSFVTEIIPQAFHLDEVSSTLLLYKPIEFDESCLVFAETFSFIPGNFPINVARGSEEKAKFLLELKEFGILRPEKYYYNLNNKCLYYITKSEELISQIVNVDLLANTLENKSYLTPSEQDAIFPVSPEFTRLEMYLQQLQNSGKKGLMFALLLNGTFTEFVCFVKPEADSKSIFVKCSSSGYRHLQLQTFIETFNMNVEHLPQFELLHNGNCGTYSALYHGFMYFLIDNYPTPLIIEKLAKNLIDFKHFRLPLRIIKNAEEKGCDWVTFYRLLGALRTSFERKGLKGFSQYCLEHHFDSHHLCQTDSKILFPEAAINQTLEIKSEVYNTKLPSSPLILDKEKLITNLILLTKLFMSKIDKNKKKHLEVLISCLEEDKNPAQKLKSFIEQMQKLNKIDTASRHYLKTCLMVLLILSTGILPGLFILFINARQKEEPVFLFTRRIDEKYKFAVTKLFNKNHIENPYVFFSSNTIDDKERTKEKGLSMCKI